MSGMNKIRTLFSVLVLCGSAESMALAQFQRPLPGPVQEQLDALTPDERSYLAAVMSPEGGGFSLGAALRLLPAYRQNRDARAAEQFRHQEVSALKMLSNIDPASPKFSSSVSEVFTRFPLAINSAQVQKLLDLKRSLAATSQPVQSTQAAPSAPVPATPQATTPSALSEADITDRELYQKWQDRKRANPFITDADNRREYLADVADKEMKLRLIRAGLPLQEHATMVKDGHYDEVAVEQKLYDLKVKAAK